MEVRDFRIEIGLGGPIDYEVSLRTPDGSETTTSMRLPLPAGELQDLAARVPFAVVASSATVRRSASTDEQPVRRLGKVLYDAFLHPERTAELPVRPPLVLQDAASGLRVVPDGDLPADGYRQLLALDQARFRSGSVHYDRASHSWRTETNEAKADKNS